MSSIVPWTTPGEDPCCCCQPPTLLCDTRAKSENKAPICGFTNPEDGKKYLKLTTTLSKSITYIESAGICEETRTDSCLVTTVATYNTATCEPNEPVTTGSAHKEIHEVCTSGFTRDIICDSTYADGIWTSFQTYDDSTGAHIETTFSSPCTEIDPLPVDVYEDEALPEPTDAFIARVITDLPTFPNTFLSLSCEAMRDLSSDESNFTVQQLQYKFRFTPPGGGVPYTINWVEHFTPEPPGFPVDTLKSWTWDGSNPGVEQDSIVFTLTEPEEDGVTTIENIEVTCEPA